MYWNRPNTVLQVTGDRKRVPEGNVNIKAT